MLLKCFCATSSELYIRRPYLSWVVYQMMFVFILWRRIDKRIVVQSRILFHSYQLYWSHEEQHTKSGRGSWKTTPSGHSTFLHSDFILPNLDGCAKYLELMDWKLGTGFDYYCTTTLHERYLVVQDIDLPHLCIQIDFLQPLHLPLVIGAEETLLLTHQQVVWWFLFNLLYSQRMAFKSRRSLLP